MLSDVKNVITRIATFLKDNENFETVIDDDGLAINVYPRNGKPGSYHGYELYLIDSVVTKLGGELVLRVNEEEGEHQFTIGTDANYDLVSFVSATNIKLREFQSDEINTVYLTEKLCDTGRGEFAVLTGFTDGTWKRCDITKAELLYAAINDMQIARSDDGVFWFPELIEMNNKFFDELG